MLAVHKIEYQPTKFWIDHVLETYTELPVDYEEMTLEDFNVFIQSNKSAWLTYRSSIQAAERQLAYVTENILTPAMEFGEKLILRVTSGNILLGITQAGKTHEMQDKLLPVVTALRSGSLYDARAALLAIPEQDKDSTFITNARIIQAVNLIEEFLGLTLSTLA